MLAFSGVPGFFRVWIGASGFGFYTVLLIFIAVLVVLGAILDSTSIMLITVPSDVFIGVFPFVIIMIVVLALLVIFPQLSLMLL